MEGDDMSGSFTVSRGECKMANSKDITKFLQHFGDFMSDIGFTQYKNYVVVSLN